MHQLPLGVRLPDHATFDSFHEAGNAAAVACLRALASGELASPSVFVTGRPGTGKSHLLQAVSAAVAHRGRRSGYVALPPLRAQGDGEGFLDGWAGLSVVCLDGIDAVAGDRAWETAVMRLYNRLREASGTLVAAAAAHVNALPWTLPDLRSRLASGLLVDLLPLGDDDAAIALQARATARGMELPQETATWLLRRYRRDMHSLCALLDSLDEASLVQHRRLTVPFVRELARTSALGRSTTDT